WGPCEPPTAWCYRTAARRSSGPATRVTWQYASGAGDSASYVVSASRLWTAAHKWSRGFGLFRRQLLAIMDAVDRVVYVSPFTHWLLQPAAFERGRLAVLGSDWRGTRWAWEEQAL